MSKPLVAIIGAGVSGLACAWQCLNAGLDVMVLEQSNHIGGVWWFDEKAKTTCVLPNMVSNTRASELSFPGFPFEDFKQDFPTPSEYCLYLQSFVDKFDLEDAIRFNAQVDKVTPSEKDPSCWVVQITDLSVNVPMVFEKVDFVVLANGHFQKPRVFTDEEIPGVESLPKAMQLHSSQFRTTAVASQKNVLVVGIGASAVEILSQVTRVAQEVVACSMRLTGMAKSPRSARSAVSPRTVGTDIGGVTSVRPRIKSISKTGEVTFDDRSTFKPDLIIWCTGFVYDFPMLPKQMIPMRAGYPELYMHMFPMSALCFEDNLAIIGLPSVNGTECVLSLACEQSKLFAALASGKCELPNKKAREAWVQEWQKKSIPSYRPLRVDFKAYVTELNSLIGLKSVVVQDRSFQSSRRTSVSVHSSGESDEEGETEEEGEESNEVAQTPMKRVEPAATVVAQPPAPVPVEAVAAAAATTSPSPGTASPARKLTKSEGSLMGKDAIVKNDRPPPPTTAAPAVPAGAGAFGQPPPAKVGNSQNVAPSPAVSRINSAGSDLQSSKTGVFASFKRTPVKETGTSGLLDRFRAEKKASPYPEDALRKRVRMLSASVHPLMVCVPMSAACGEIGKRDLMEDTHVLLDRIPGVPETIPSGIWCVYDGHGGQEVSRMAEQLLHVKFQKMLINALIIEGKSVNEVNVERLLRRCFKETDKAINEKLWDLKNGGVGSTAAVCVLLGRRLFVANAGDSEVVVSVCRVGEGKTSSIEMSHKHKPRDEREKLRIETMGGMVFGGRVYGTLSVARGFGDTQFKPPSNPQFIISPDPDVKCIELGPQHRYIILGCDGLWDKLSHDECAEFVHELREAGYSVQECAEWLVKEADDRISRDNITVVVVDLQWSVDAKLEAPKTCSECQAVTFGMQYCTKCGLPWPGIEVDTSIRQAPSVKGKRERPYKPKKLAKQDSSDEEEEIVIGVPMNVVHTSHAQTQEEMKKLLNK